MYIPSFNRLDSQEKILALIRSHSFSTMVLPGAEGLDAVHLPILIDSEEPLVLAGHVAKANPIWKAFEAGREALIVFAGPHGYISPSTYMSRPNVPTWNYAVVHAAGTPRIVHDSEEAIVHLRQMMRFFDPELELNHPESFEEPLLRSMLNGVVAFKMPVDRLQGKAKMSQNKTDGDRSSARDALVATGRPELIQVADWMTDEV